MELPFFVCHSDSLVAVEPRKRVRMLWERAVFAKTQTVLACTYHDIRRFH